MRQEMAEVSWEAAEEKQPSDKYCVRFQYRASLSQLRGELPRSQQSIWELPTEWPFDIAG